ncbi:MAG: YfhO family protein [Lachnospiraceae bacterium]|nr:YfhO family protein [Lachnospiraceae bacterium]
MKKVEKSQSKARKNLPLILSFVIPVILMLIVYYIRKIYPFGDRVFLRIDMYHQYAPFTIEFMNKLKSGGSLLYSWHIGLGTNFTALFAYYLATPYNWLLPLIPKSTALEFMGYGIILKIGLCGLSFAYYLKKKFNTNSYAIVLFAICYAMSGYIAAYNWNIMWLDCIILAPLIMLGIEQIVNEGKGWLYCVALALCIFTNYYISIMVCLFSVIYFAALFLSTPVTEKGPGYLRRFLNFALYSLLAGGFAAILLIPELNALRLTASANSTFPKNLTNYFSIFDMSARHLISVDTELGLDHWPNIYCGVAVVFLLPLYIMNKKIPARQKIANISILFIFLLSYCLNIPNYIWHGLHYPNSLPCRQSFLYIALLLAVCFEAVHCIKGCSIKQIAGAFWGAIGFVLLCEKFITHEDFTYNTFLLSGIFIAFYALLLYLYHQDKLQMAVLAVVAICLVSVELTVNMLDTGISTVGRDAYLENLDNYKALVNYAETINQDFYRMEKFQRKTKNDASLAGFNSATIFSSTANAHVSSLYTTLGMEANTNAYCFQGATPLTQALLAVKYMFTDKTMNDPLYSTLSSSGNITLMQCRYTLGLGFMLNSDFENQWNKNGASPIENQNSFSYAAGGGTLFEEIATINNGSSYSVPVSEAEHVYIYIPRSDVESVTVSAGSSSNTYENIGRGYIIDGGYRQANEVITVTNPKGSGFTMYAYKFLADNYISLINKLSANSFIYDSERSTETHIYGTITADKAGIMYTSIPYEKGWKVKVDGKSVDAVTFSDTMLAINLDAGTHDIELKFRPDGLVPGAVISIISTLIIAAIILLPYLIKKGKIKKLNVPKPVAEFFFLNEN